MSDERITQKYIRRYPTSRRTKSWAGRLVHIRTEHGVWRTSGHGYTDAHALDAWVLPFEEAQKQVAHCGPEKMASFIAVRERNRDVAYRCTGCGSVTHNPHDYIALIQKAGGLSCCPESDFRAVALSEPSP